MASIVNWFVENFFWIQVISTLISIALVVAVIRLAIKIDYYADRREYGWEIWKLKGLRRRKLEQLWKRALKKIARPEPGRWKEVVFEVNDFFDDTLKGIGYIGSSAEERISKVGKENVSNIDELTKIQEEIKSLKSDGSSILGHEKAKEYLRTYRKAFRELGLLE
jgi:hypothetical protein